ncbi:Zn2Cys6 transcription factor [Trichoderma parareesei]|uniref:Zn2Cys6 transcription factor n=1 Tax=Trichoderma parareesei TaxID=858221 RepID=A0A2H2ZZD7_TRIPA|nr:Zn2Cys6 transcription factor [Trichoderma parareesei]
MAGGSRTFHHKSRNGCGRCKKRRVRCNLQAPSCSNCTRRGELCDYRFLGSDSISPSNLSSSHAAYVRRRSRKSGSSSPEAPLVVGPMPSFTAPASHPLPDVDAAPIRAASRPVVDSMALCLLRDDERHLISEELVDQTDASDFLEHNMAMISTLHSSSTSSLLKKDSDKARSDLSAYQHQIAASSRFRSSVGAISDRNWFTVLVFAISVLIFHFDIHRRAKRGLADDEFLEPILALRGAAMLGMELGPWLMKSRLLAVIRRRVAAENPPWDHLAEQAVTNLQMMNEARTALGSTREVCKDALEKMQFWLRLTSCRPRTWLHFVWWPGAIDQEYLHLLETRDPMALVILVHWCAVMKASPRKWFMEGWAENVARPAIAQIAQIGPEWDGAMQWALSRIGAGGSR